MQNGKALVSQLPHVALEPPHILIHGRVLVYLSRQVLLPGQSPLGLHATPVTQAEGHRRYHRQTYQPHPPFSGRYSFL
jgi:hypothetical protein